MSAMDADDAPNTEVGWMYRDASNYKQNASTVFAGRLLPVELQAILANLDSGEFFIPSQVGLHDLQESFGSRLYDDDHVWHEIAAEDFRPTYAPAAEEVDIHAFAVKMATTEWDVEAAESEHGLDVVHSQAEYAGLPAPAREVADHVLLELEQGVANGLRADEDFAADVVTRLIRVYPDVIPTARAAMADLTEDPA